MTVLTSQQIVGTALPSLAPTSSSGPAGAGLGAAIKDTWVDNGRQKEVKNRAQRRAAIAKARAAVEEKATTKNERLQRQQGGVLRQAGSEAERRDTRGTIAKASAALEGVATDTMWSDPDFREARAMLRQSYPDRKLSEMLEIGLRLTDMLREDPVAAREQMLAAWSRLPTTAYDAPQHAQGARGSLQRAAADREDMQDLAEHAAKHGKNLSKMIQELAALNHAMAQDPAGVSARIAARYGAPVLESEVAPYQAKQARHQDAANVSKAFDIILRHNVLPGFEDPKIQHAIADVLESKTFQRTGDRLADLKAAHAQVMANRAAGKTAAKRSEAGSKSISGGSPGRGQGEMSYADRERGKGSIRDSIARVRDAM